MWKQKYPAGSSAAEITRYRTGNTLQYLPNAMPDLSVFPGIQNPDPTFFEL